MIPHSLIERFFGASAMQRWNDRVRPVDLTELDKQAHKAMIAFLLGKFEEERGQAIDWIRVIEGLIFEFLPRVVLTDIKAPLFHQLMKKHGPAIRAHVLHQVRPELEAWNSAVAARFEAYLMDTDGSAPERRILAAAHYLATQWEFKIVQHANPFVFGLDTTQREIEHQQEDFIDLLGVRKIQQQGKAYGFVDLCAQLRFQQRWAQTPRLPRTTVLGHSLFVAAMVYLSSVELEACPRRGCNNFFCALFHDLPEVFTRDIISPVKKGVEGLERFIAIEERRMVEDSLLPLLPDAWHSQIRYYLDDPFENRIRENGARRTVEWPKLHETHNRDACDPVDGEIIKGFDDLAALVEAYKSLEIGIHPLPLRQAVHIFKDKYRDRRTGPIVWQDYFASFQTS